ncbi:golgin subfamily A member 4-like isoform X2 [Mauremys mutica]|uniref:golgin subfamily A member 4-like isoform X2 n=1 Tax=Mauremys mutica TaxID=74926 RepID=UPI001D161776|nr:golgin subfamily A member 4-like isoform X2 [Mauremys mutica]
MKSQAMKTTLMQDSAYQTLCALSAQKNPRKKSGLFETTSARKLQTSFPPIHFSLSTPSRSMYKSFKDHVSNLDVSRDIRGQKVNLPQVEKPSEKISAPIQSVTAVNKSKVTTDHSRYLRARSNTLVVPFLSTREIKLENKSRLDLPSSKVASEGLSAETHKVPECPNCKKERRIQNEYDKFILQSKRDKEALQKTIVKLEAELKRYEEHHKPAQRQESEVTGSVEEQQYLRGEVSLLDGLEGMCKNELAYMRSRSDLNKLEEESKRKRQQMDSLLVEMEELKAQLQRIQNNEEKQAQMTKMKQSKLVLEMEELKSQLEKTKERERQKVSVLENEKDACLREIAEMKTCIEKMGTENSSLMEKMKALENRSSCCCLASVVHGNAEILTISHHSTFCVDAESPHCFNSCGGATCNSGTQSGKCVAGTSSVEDDEIGMKEMYKQLAPAWKAP